MSSSSKKRKLSVAVGDKVDALWPADGEYYPAKVRAINDDGTIALTTRTATRNDATTSELRCKKPLTASAHDTRGAALGAVGTVTHKPGRRPAPELRLSPTPHRETSTRPSAASSPKD